MFFVFCHIFFAFAHRPNGLILKHFVKEGEFDDRGKQCMCHDIFGRRLRSGLQGVKIAPLQCIGKVSMPHISETVRTRSKRVTNSNRPSPMGVTTDVLIP